MNPKLLILLCFASVISGQEVAKKRVHFKDDNGGGNDFNFGDPIKPKTKSFGVTPVATAHQLQQSQQAQQRFQPGQVIFKKTTSALKKPQAQPQSLHQSQPQSQYQSLHHHHHHQQQQQQQFPQQLPPHQQQQQQNGQILKQGSLNENGPFMPAATPPPFPDQTAFLLPPPNLNAQLQQQTDGRRQLGPTPQSLAYTSPQRFYLPQNAPMTGRAVQGPNLPLYYGVPGQDIPPIRNLDAYSPQVGDGYVGQRDAGFDQVIVDPVADSDLDVLNTNPIEAAVPIVPPCVQTELRRVTPLQPAVTNPLSPEVTNNRGPFFPNQPETAGAFIQTPPEPQLIAQPLDDGPYYVEPVRDPIVFFDPNSNQTLVYDPLRDFTRPYNPDTDPELMDDVSFASASAAAVQDQARLQQQQPDAANPSSNNPNVGGPLLLKSGGQAGSSTTAAAAAAHNSSPKFWIIRRQPIDNGYEKSTINGAASQPPPPPPPVSNENLIIKSIGKRNLNAGLIQAEAQPIVLLKSGERNQAVTTNGKFSNVPTEKLIVQVKSQQQQQQQRQQQLSKNTNNSKKSLFTESTPTAPNNDSNSNSNRSPTKSTLKDDQGRGYVKLVYSPIVEVPIGGSRYQGFKAQGSSSAVPYPNILYALLAATLLPVLTAFFF